LLRRQHAYRLDATQPGASVGVVTIAEVVEDGQALIRLLHGKGLPPGTEPVVVERGAGGCVLPVNGGRMHVAGNVAHMVWVCGRTVSASGSTTLRKEAGCSPSWVHACRPSLRSRSF
jgi:hypothetical protein